MDYLALRIPVDVAKPITAHTVTDQPEPEDGGGYPFEGENGAYALTEAQTIEIVPAAYTDVRKKQHLDGDLYCDEEGLMKGRVRNWRASQLRHWFFSKIQDQLEPNWRDYTHIAGDAVFVVRGTEENVKIMESILDS